MKTSKKYNNKEIMRRAWELRRTFGLTMGDAMKAAWAEAKAAAGVSEMDSTIQRLFDAKAELDKAKAVYDAIAAEVQGVCLLAPDCTISGYGWKASFKEVTSNRLDSKALKADYADLYKRYSRPQTTRRFICNPVALPA